MGTFRLCLTDDTLTPTYGGPRGRGIGGTSRTVGTCLVYGMHIILVAAGPECSQPPKVPANWYTPKRSPRVRSTARDTWHTCRPSVTHRTCSGPRRRAPQGPPLLLLPRPLLLPGHAALLALPLLRLVLLPRRLGQQGTGVIRVEGCVLNHGHQVLM